MCRSRSPGVLTLDSIRLNLSFASYLRREAEPPPGAVPTTFLRGVFSSEGYPLG